MAYYDSKKYRGLALVIGNEKFDKKVNEKRSKDRPGCVEDIKMMEQMFERLDYFVMCFKDLTADKMLEKIKQASIDARNEDCEGFVLVLSTHGSEKFDATNKAWRHEVMGTDGKYVIIEDILEMFQKRNAPALAGKPKLFFIQACRSKDRNYSSKETEKENKIKDSTDSGKESTDSGIIANIPVSKKSAYAEMELPREFSDDKLYFGCDDLYKGWQKDSECWLQALDKHSENQKRRDPSYDAGGEADSGDLPSDPVDISRINCPEDCLLYYPVVSGKKAPRHPSKGSYMMVYLWEQFPKLLRGLSFHQYLTYVNRAMADHEVLIERKDPYKITASVVHRMTKHVKFLPKSKSSPMARAKEIIERNDNN